MSRRPQTNTTLAAVPTTSALPSDICPVCKRVRYLNTDMRFLINPDCYHAMCSQCVTNIFKSGPAQCPYATCTKTLRFKGFHDAFFADLAVEREVDIRRRVAAVFNMEREDFESLRAFNDYLQKVEDLTFSLVNGAEAERRRAEDQLTAHEAENKAKIERNKLRVQEAESRRRLLEADTRAAAELRRRTEMADEERARQEEASLNAEVMEALARGEPGSAAEIQERILATKRAKIARINGAHFPSNMLSIRGLRSKRAAELDEEEDERDRNKPYSPFMGLRKQSTRYKVRHEDMDHTDTWVEGALKREDHQVAGYSTTEYVTQAFANAFAGLGVIGAEERGKETIQIHRGAKELGTVMAVDRVKREGVAAGA